MDLSPTKSKDQENMKKVMIYGLRMRQEAKEGIIPGHFRPLADQIEFITSILYNNNQDFRDSINLVRDTLLILNETPTQKATYRESNKMACEIMQHCNDKRRNIEHSALERNAYKFERLRRDSFASWPRNKKYINDLAARGFYYIQYLDLIRCFSCDLEIGRWKLMLGEKIARIEHHYLSRECPVLRGFSNNISIMQEVPWIRPMNIHAPISINAQESSKIMGRTHIRKLPRLEPGITNIENLELSFRGKGFGNKKIYGQCKRCNKVLFVWRTCLLCMIMNEEQNGENIYAVCMACPNEYHQRELLITNLCAECKAYLCECSACQIKQIGKLFHR